MFAAERQLAAVRVATIAVNIFSYLVLSVGADPAHRPLALVIVAFSGTYCIWVFLAEPYRRYPVLFSALFTTLTDSALILVWVYVTGSYESPFYVLLFISVFAIAFRFPRRDAVTAALLYAVGYLLLMAATGQLIEHLGTLWLRAAYVFLSGMVGAGLSHELAQQASARIKLEKEVRAQRELEVSRAQLAEAQRLAHVGSFSWDRATGAMIWSDELIRIVGADPKGQTQRSLFGSFSHPDDVEALQRAVERALRDGTPIELEHRVVRPDGEVRTVQIRARAESNAGTPSTSLPNAASNSNPDLTPTAAVDLPFARLVGTVQDITEARALQARLFMTDRMASLGTLAGGVAHEINNPLTYIIANLDFLSAGLQKAQAQAQAQAQGQTEPAQFLELDQVVKETREGAERVRRVVSDLRTFSRPDQEKQGLVDVHEALELAMKMAWNQIRHRAVLVRDLLPVPRILGDGSRLGQVFLNMLINATQAIPEGRRESNHIRVATKTEEGRVVISIEDSGSGIPAEIQRRIFDPFFTTKPVGEGTGLGLSICLGIVKRLGGDIRVESVVGEGTRFQVILPPAPALTLEPAAEESTGTGPRARVLIVDDDAMVGRSLQRSLSREHDVALVKCGRDALQCMDSGERFDVILCDLMMPELTGMDVYAEVARRDPLQAKRMVFVTGGAFSEQTRRFLEQTPNPVFEKPVDFKALRKVIQKLRASAAERTPGPAQSVAN
jgi:C4-dicarboxylate-specific signal transduction histidine kinase/ActR/RegA family two-component response regulator